MLENKANHYRVLTQLNQIFKKERSISKFNPNEIACSSINKGHLNGKRIDRVIFYLRGTGCTWCRTISGGCFMCGHYHGTTKGQHLHQNTTLRHYKQFLKEFNKYDFSKYPMLCLYNAGSLLSHDEISDENLIKIFKKINSNPESQFQNDLVNSVSIPNVVP